MTQIVCRFELSLGRLKLLLPHTQLSRQLVDILACFLELANRTISLLFERVVLNLVDADLSGRLIQTILQRDDLGFQTCPQSVQPNT